MKKTFITTFVFMALMMALVAHAQTNGANLTYTPLEPIPGITSGFDVTNPANLPALINAVFKILFTVGALFSVLMLTLSGIRYMLSDVVTNKEKAKKRIAACLWGLLLLAVSWLILNTINPQLLNFSLNPCPTAGTCTVAQTTTTSTPTATQLPPADNVSTTAASAAVNGNVVAQPNNPAEALTLTVPINCGSADNVVTCLSQMQTATNAFNTQCTGLGGKSQIVSGNAVGATGATQDYICKTQ